MKRFKNSYYIYIFALLLFIVFLLSFTTGRYPVSIEQLVKALLYRIFPMEKTWSNTIDTIVFQVRLPRIIGAMLVGTALSTSGAVYQGMFKNPLVSPDILGVSSGAAFGAALAIYLSFNSIGIQISSFVFGLAGVGLVYLIGTRIKEAALISLVISGVLVGSIFTALTSLIKYLADTNDKLPTITFWLMGSLSGISPSDIKVMIIPILLGLLPLFMLRWRLNVLSLAEEESKTLGLNTGKLIITVIICSTLITATSVSVTGMIGWIGLVIPHLSRMIVGPDFRFLLPTAMLLGSTYLLLIDNIARGLAAVEIPLGILTALIGAPFFIIVLLSDKRS